MNFELVSMWYEAGAKALVRGQDGREYTVSCSARIPEAMVFARGDEVACYRGVTDLAEALARFSAEPVERIYARMNSPWTGDDERVWRDDVRVHLPVVP